MTVSSVRRDSTVRKLAWKRPDARLRVQQVGFEAEAGLDRCSLTSSSLTALWCEGKYSDEFGLTSSRQCKRCHSTYQGWQCDHEIVPRKGYFDSTSGQLLTPPN
eukprot:scaffold1610_cov257-Pinguiococcus_pyrenoidosus.AAC.14